jgi:hypothetical protein
MKTELISMGAALALLCGGCSKIEMARMDKETERDAVIMVQRYKEAQPSQVESVLNEYLTLTDGYERKGWGKYGKPGWIEYLRAMCEARLAVFCRANGSQEQYKIHMDRAVVHLRKRAPEAGGTDQEAAASLENLITGLDTKNIDPNWRKQLGQPNGAANRGQPVRLETNQTSATAGPGR